MSELLAPAGSLDSFYAAVSNGADAVYFGLNSFSARAYALNFSLDDVKLITSYAHLRGIKVYCTMNTILFDNELDEAYKMVDFLASINVDAIITQDLALINYITTHYESIEAHISTQVGIDDLEGIKFCEKLGAKRVVLAREVNIDKIKEFKEKTSVSIEAFIHGALCVSYSGDCFMSGLIGLRSGNRGRCVGCCKKLYTLIDNTNNQEINTSYLYSMKDLNTSVDIEKLNIVDSLKIEGRMKDPNYVAAITNYYRNKLDGKDVDEEILYKNFQRTFTKGYLLNEDPKDITNTIKPNNFGYPIGKVVHIKNNRITIKLDKIANQFDQLRIGNYLEEVSIPLVKMYDRSNRLINSSNDEIIIEAKDKVKVGDIVYKTKDYLYQNEVSLSYPKEYKRIPIDFKVIGKINKELIIEVIYQNIKIQKSSSILIQKALKRGVSKDNFMELLSKLNDTPYILNNIDFDIDDDIFVPLKEISSLKRDLIEELNQERLKFDLIKKDTNKLIVPKHTIDKPRLSVEVRTKEQYDVAKKMGIDTIYYKNYVPRNNASMKEIDGLVLVGGLNGVEHYKNKNFVVSDYSLNIVNHESVALLESLGINRITLSYEVSKNHIESIINEFYKKYQTYPNIELIVYGRQKLMVSKYCPLRHLNMCGKCKTNSYSIKDEKETFPLLFNDDCSTIILNSKTLNLIDEINDLKNISYFRLSFTNETAGDMERIIKMYQDRLNGIDNVNHFDKENNTRGHFNREIL